MFCRIVGNGKIAAMVETGRQGQGNVLYVIQKDS